MSLIFRRRGGDASVSSGPVNTGKVARDSQDEGVRSNGKPLIELKGEQKEKAPAESPALPAESRPKESDASPVQDANNKVIIKLNFSVPFQKLYDELVKNEVADSLMFYCPVCCSSSRDIDLRLVRGHATFDLFKLHVLNTHQKVVETAKHVPDPIVRLKGIAVQAGIPEQGSVKADDLVELDLSKKSSPMWKNFCGVRGYPLAICCRECFTCIAKDSHSGTTNLNRHLASCKRAKKQSEQQTLDGHVQKVMHPDLLFLRMFASGGLPFRLVGWQPFRDWLVSVKLKDSICAPSTLSSRIMKLGKAMIEDVSMSWVC